METNGKITVMPKAQFSPATNGDLKIKTEDNFVPVTLINEGKFMEENLKVAQV